jgi:ATP/maltotriose-dependent transcriptional regulator MalT
MAGAAVIGREDELRAIRVFLDRVTDGPGALVLSGKPGIGKTVLWEAAVEEAERRFGRVLTCRGVEAEALLSFGGLSDLLADVLEEVSPLLVPLRREALEVALLLAKPGDVAPDPRAIGLAFLDVMRVLAERGPIVVAVDDTHWLDPSSAAVLQMGLRRLRGERVGLLATVREGPEVRTGFELERGFPEDKLARLSLDALSLASLHHILRERLALELTRPELGRVQEASGGNPFFALELGRELIRTDTRPAAGRALRVPESLHDLLGDRLARLPKETSEVLLSAAALARPTIDLVVTARGRREDAIKALDTAAREGVIGLDDTRVRFAHPLLASICYENARPWERRAVHRALADAVPDLEERARHLALAAEGPDPAIASELDAAAEQAAARGATAAAAELSELAAELTPDDPATVRARHLQAANLHHLAGNSERTVTLLEHVLVDAPPGLQRADALFGLAVTLKRDPRAMIELCNTALIEASADDARSARILAFLTWAHVFAGDVQASLASARDALEKAERVGDPSLLAVAIARAGHAEIWAADVTPGLLERGAEIEAGLERPLDWLESPRVPLGRLLMRRGELDQGRIVITELEADMAARGDEGSRVEALWTLSMLEWLTGRWQRALELGAAAHDLAEQIQFAHARGWLGRAKALFEADLGLVDEARASAEECLAFAQAESNEYYTNVAHSALARLELALGNFDAAAGHLRELPRRLLAGGFTDPTAPVWADAIETLVALGELELARDYLVPYELHARRLESPLAMEGVLRCGGLLAAAEGDFDAAFAAFESCLSEQPEPPWPFERGRTLLCLGMVRRQGQQKKAARDALGQALAIFEELGARLWADKARAELRRISGRRPADEELTETERRVAELAARGRTNKEIAAALFMGVSTVEAHLSRVYRKLGIRSRTELAGRIVTRGDGPAKTMDETAQV